MNQRGKVKLDIWNIRNQAFASLESNLKQEKEVLEEAFALLDKCIERLNFYIGKHADDNDDEQLIFATYCLHTMVKIRRLAIGSYNLCQDGFGLEAGALMRILIEGWQVLVFFRLDPKRIELALTNNMPKAGEIAKAIDDVLHNQIKDDLWRLRQFYNHLSSHFSLDIDALRPIEAVFDSTRLKTNMRSICSAIGQVAFDSTLCLAILDSEDAFLNNEVESFRKKSLSIFGSYTEPE